MLFPKYIIGTQAFFLLSLMFSLHRMAFPTLSTQRFLTQCQSLHSSLPPSLGLKSKWDAIFTMFPLILLHCPMTPLSMLYSIGPSCVSPRLDSMSFEVRGSQPVQVYVYNVIIILEELLLKERMKKRMNECLDKPDSFWNRISSPLSMSFQWLKIDFQGST